MVEEKEMSLVERIERIEKLLNIGKMEELHCPDCGGDFVVTSFQCSICWHTPTFVVDKNGDLSNAL